MNTMYTRITVKIVAISGWCGRVSTGIGMGGYTQMLESLQNAMKLQLYRVFGTMIGGRAGGRPSVHKTDIIEQTIPHFAPELER